MSAFLWRLIGWSLGRYIESDRLAPLVGDLNEDFDRRRAAHGRVRAAMWLMRETTSLASAYRAQARITRAGSPALLERFMDDVRLATRRLFKRPAATVASILTLACAIGASTSAWSLISSVLLHPLPVEAPDRLRLVGLQGPARNADAPPSVSYSHLFRIYRAVVDEQQREGRPFEAIAAFGAPSSNATHLVIVDGTQQNREVLWVSAEFFRTLGIRLTGPGFRPEDDRPEAPLTAIVSHSFWRKVLHEDGAVLGRDITIAGKHARIVGIAPEGFRGLNLAESPEIFLPLSTIADLNPGMNYLDERAGEKMSSPTSWVHIAGRLHNGDDGPRAVERLGPAMQRLKAGARDPSRAPSFVLMDLETAAIPEVARNGMKEFTRLLGSTVALLFLIGCLTVGMLLLIRTEARRDEFAMCLALGASRLRLARGVAVEGALLSVAGALTALPIASLLFAALRSSQLPGGVNLASLQLAIDGRALATSGLAAVLATGAIAAVAAVLGFTSQVADVLRSRGASPPLQHRRLRAVLVATQVAAALVFLAGTGVFARSLMAALSLNAGYDTARLANSSIDLAPFGYDSTRAAVFFDELGGRLRANPILRGAATTVYQGGMTTSGKITVDDGARQFPSFVAYTAVDPHYFRTMGLRILEGRDFADGDRPGSTKVVIVDNSMAREVAADGHAVGHRITESHAAIGQAPAKIEIVGIVPDVVTNVNVLAPLVIYYPVSQQRPTTSRTLVIRAATDATAAIGETMETIKSIDATVIPGPMLTMQERIGRQMSSQRFGLVVLGALGLMALVLTLLGTYVLAESMATMRRREVSIRAALGASRVRLGRQLLGETARLVGIGLAAGLLLAWAGASTIRSLLYQVQPLDPVTIAAVAATIFALALVISARPAIGAIRVDLAKTLREE